jgi:hypothetical protein
MVQTNHVGIVLRTTTTDGTAAVSRPLRQLGRTFLRLNSKHGIILFVIFKGVVVVVRCCFVALEI